MKQTALETVLGDPSEPAWNVGSDIINSLPVILLLADLQTQRCCFVSRYAQDLLGYPLEQWLSQPDFWAEHLHPDDRESVLCVYRAATEKSPTQRLEYRMISANGSGVWLQDICTVQFYQGQALRRTSLLLEITHRKENEEQLLRQTAQAQQANRLKTEFLANMSHEIRTPMNGIIGFADLLAAEELPPQQEEWAKLIRSCGQDLLALIDDILDISKIEANQIRIDPCQFGIRDFIEDIIQFSVPAIQAKGLSFRVDYADHAPSTINSDPQRLRQILTNLLTNAEKFTDSGKITLRTAADSLEGRPAVRFEVADTGIGISPEHQEIIFEVFKQADTSASRKYQGSGLGLAICKRLAKLLGGNISLESRPGYGATFIVILPLQPPAELAPVLGQQTASQEPESAGPQPSRSLQAGNCEPSGIVQLQGHALLVEDNSVNRNLFRIILTRAGLRVDLACDGGQAVQMASNNRYDLILMDLQMPVLDGLEATRALRGKGLTTPIIALTAHGMNYKQQTCFQAGCNSFLTKPLNQAVLLAAVQQYLQPSAETQA